MAGIVLAEQRKEIGFSLDLCVFVTDEWRGGQ